MRLERRDIDALEKRRRVALINSLSGFKAATLVGTADDKGRSNLAIFNSLMHIGASPPLLGLIFRPDSVERHTLSNLRQRGFYTVNHVQESFFEAAHQTSARYPREVSEFEAVGLTELREPGFEAPFVAEASVRIGLKLTEEVPVKANGTYLVVGEIVNLCAPDAALTDAGDLDCAAAGGVAVSGLSTYYRARLLTRLDYAKPPA
jgi:flavin reductase (DIM6/NTAB) family NADH-FMN oxidoreductase RutF